MTQLVKCKFCKTEFASNAKACPNCGKPPLSTHLGVIAVTIGVILCAVIFIVPRLPSLDPTSLPPQTLGEETSMETVTLTAEQRKQIENKWGGALSYHCQELQKAFEKFRQGKFNAYAVYKKGQWLPEFSKNSDVMVTGWRKFGSPAKNPDFNNMKEILSAMTDLNSVSVDILSYIRKPKEDDLRIIYKKFAEISELSAPYAAFHPKP
jgi:hypothetical protein